VYAPQENKTKEARGALTSTQLPHIPRRQVAFYDAEFYGIYFLCSLSTLLY
jgi:hypothetical protein